MRKSEYRKIKESDFWPKVGFFYLAILTFTHILIALFALGFSQYAIALLPQLNPNLTAIGIMLLFYVVNLFGVKQAASIQKIMIVLLLCGRIIIGQS